MIANKYFKILNKYEQHKNRQFEDLLTLIEENENHLDFFNDKYFMQNQFYARGASTQDSEFSISNIEITQLRKSTINEKSYN